MAGEPVRFVDVTRWRVPGRIADVYAVLTDVQALPRWWPELYHRVREIAPGDAEGRGRTTEIVTRGKLPYEVRWRLTVTDVVPPRLIRLTASGDVTGEGEWVLAEDGDAVTLAYTWRVLIEKPWMKRLAFLLMPLFRLNHAYVMGRGEAGLRRELARRISG